VKLKNVATNMATAKKPKTLATPSVEWQDRAAAWLTINLNAFCMGIIDTFSLHRTIRILVNDSTSARLTAQILGTNAALLLGSIYFYSKGLGPLLNYMKLNMAEEVPVVSYADQLGWVMYQALWLVPTCALCYGCSMTWYQDLSDSTYRYLQGVPKTTALTKSVGQALYGTLVWASAFVQVKLLAALGPMLFAQVNQAIDLFFLGLTASPTGGTSSSLFVSILLGLKAGIKLWVHSASLTSRYAGLALLCLMYGWYGFDPKWISSGMDPDTRFGIMERHWAYFMGFGFPYVLLMENTSFFVGYGVFLAMFPFCIMLGSVCDYAAPYKGLSDAKLPVNTHNNALPMFRPAQQWTLLAIKYIDKQAYAAQKERHKQQSSGGGVKNSSTRSTSGSKTSTSKATAAGAAEDPVRNKKDL
jgi:hypothetical protein